PIFFGLALLFIVILGIVIYLYVSISHQKQYLVTKNKSTNDQEFIIFHKDGYLWKSNLRGKNTEKIVAYPNSDNAAHDAVIMWDISPDNKYMLTNLENKELAEI